MINAIKTQLGPFLESPFSNALLLARERGDRLIGYTCSYVPAPLLSVDGLAAVSLRAPGVSATPLADTYLSSVLCSYTRSLLENALDGMYGPLDGWVHACSCDHLRRLFDNLDYLLRPPFNYILDLPHRTNPAALNWFEEELRLLAASLRDRFNVDTGPAAISRAIESHNECADLLAGLSRLRYSNPTLITGTEFHSIVTAVSNMPGTLAVETLASLRNQFENAEPPSSRRARLLLAGSRMDNPAFIEVIESLGALVTGDRTCFGPAPGFEKIETGGDPLRALAAHYLLKVACPRMMEEFGPRVDAIVSAARDCRADGVILQTMKFCDCWGVEAAPLVEELRAAGLPVLRLERDYSLTGEGQLRTRVQAFLESMGK